MSTDCVRRSSLGPEEQYDLHVSILFRVVTCRFPAVLYPGVARLLGHICLEHFVERSVLAWREQCACRTNSSIVVVVANI